VRGGEVVGRGLGVRRWRFLVVVGVGLGLGWVLLLLLLAAWDWCRLDSEARSAVVSRWSRRWRWVPTRCRRFVGVCLCCWVQVLVLLDGHLRAVQDCPSSQRTMISAARPPHCCPWSSTNRHRRERRRGWPRRSTSTTAPLRGRKVPNPLRLHHHHRQRRRRPQLFGHHWPRDPSELSHLRLGVESSASAASVESWQG
jgi:hypothetical protein